MKLRELLKKFDLWLRPAHVQGEDGEGNRPVDNLYALASAFGPKGDVAEGNVPAMAPPNWVPSQQDERPRH